MTSFEPQDAAVPKVSATSDHFSYGELLIPFS